MSNLASHIKNNIIYKLSVGGNSVMPPKLNVEYVKKIVENYECELISGYNSYDELLEIKCSCGKNWFVTFHSFRKNNHTHKCDDCSSKINGDKRKLNPVELLDRIKDYGYYFDPKDYYLIDEKIIIKNINGYKYYLTCNVLLGDLKNNNEPQEFSIINPFTFENINLWIKNNNKNFELIKILPPKKNRLFVSLRCKKCNQEWNTIFSNILKDEGCPYCAKRRAGNKDNLEILFPYLMIEWDYKKNKKSPSKYRSKSNQSVYWICFQCGYKWKAKISDRTKGHGCFACNMSGGSKKIYFWLKENSLKFGIEKKFYDLLSDLGNPLRYDFVVYDKRKDIIITLIEFDGQQHEKFVSGFHKDYDSFQLCKKYDKRKNEYAKNKNIELLRISYKEYKDIDNILSTRLSSYITV
jgi:hypothetical protein